MDERLSKALDFANYSVTLANQKRALKEKYLADIVHYHNGGCFSVSKELINFVKLQIDTGNDAGVVLIDDSDTPIEIADMNEFFDTVLNKYFAASNEFYTEYQKIRKNRTVEGLVK